MLHRDHAKPGGCPESYLIHYFDSRLPKARKKSRSTTYRSLYELDIREADLYFGPVTDMKSLRLTLSTIDLLGVTTEYLLTAALS